jgi:magnesium transporter
VHVLTAADDARITDLRARDEFFWLDLLDPPPGELDMVADLLGLHPMAVEDTLEFGQRPKVDVYESNVQIVFYTAEPPGGDDDETAGPIEVHVYVSGSFALTVRRRPCGPLEQLRERLKSEPTHDEAYLVYLIFDGLTDAYYPVLDALEQRLDRLEGEVLQRPRREQLTRIYRMSQMTRELHRLAADQRDHFPAASDALDGLAGLSRGSREYLRDVSDHLIQIAAELGRQQDDLRALSGTYFNANSDRLNAVATRVTVIGVLFVTWTLVTGFFGQNFGWLVGNIDSREDFLVFGLGGLMVPTVITLALVWAKRRDWF